MNEISNDIKSVIRILFRLKNEAIQNGKLEATAQMVLMAGYIHRDLKIAMNQKDEKTKREIEE